MTDPSSAKPRRTLTATKTAGAPATKSADERTRSGPRAKFVQLHGPKPERAPRPANAPRRDDALARPARSTAPTRGKPFDQADTNVATRARPAKPPRGARAEPATEPPARHDPSAIRYFAPCPRGLEQPLHAELIALGLSDARIVAGGLRFSGDLEAGWRVNLASRIASRVLREVDHFPYRDENDVFARAAALDWAAWFNVECTIKVEIAARNSPVRSLEFVALRIKDAVCDVFRAATGSRPDVDTSRPDVRIHAFLDDRYTTLYLDTSGEALFKRGWRHGSVDAPLRENLAAGLLALSGWAPGVALVDPFCGSGTLAIEAAQIAQQRAPGAWRHFSFERFNDVDAQRWDAMRTPAPRDDTALPIVASDVSQAAVDIARGNAKRAGAPIDLHVIDAREILPPALGEDQLPGLVIGNPPYGERAQFFDAHGALIDASQFWLDFANNLKLHWSGWRLALISSDVDLPKHLKLAPTRKLPLYNGALECQLYLFTIGPRSDA